MKRLFTVFIIGLFFFSNHASGQLSTRKDFPFRANQKTHLLTDKSSNVEMEPKGDASKSLFSSGNIFAKDRNGNKYNKSLIEVIFEEDFESASEIPSGWQTFNMGNSNEEWLVVDNSGNTGNNSLYHTFDQNFNVDNWVVTPSIHLENEENRGYFINFFTRNADYSFYTYSGVYVSVGSANPADEDFIPLLELDQDLSNWTEKYIDITGYTGETIYIAFRYQGVNGHIIWIDDVGVKSAPVVTTFSWVEPFWSSQPEDAGWSRFAMEPDYQWQLNDNSPFFGNYNLLHDFSPQGTEASSFIYSPRIFLPEEASGLKFQLAFHERNLDMFFYDRSRVFIANSPFMIDIETDSQFLDGLDPIYDSDVPINEWTQTRLDLDNYMGKGFNIAFNYKGEYAHIWEIDNVRIDALIESLPWTENFGTSFPMAGWLNFGWSSPTFLDFKTDSKVDFNHYIFTFNDDAYFITPVANIPEDGNNYMVKISANALPWGDSGLVFSSDLAIGILDETSQIVAMETFEGINHREVKEYWVSLNDFKGQFINIAVAMVNAENNAGLKIEKIAIKSVPDRDIALTKLAVPEKAITGKPYSFYSKVQNTGYETLSIAVSSSIRYQGEWLLQETNHFSDMRPGEKGTVVKDNFFSDYTGDHNVRVIVTASGDDVPGNEDITTSVSFGNYPHALALELLPESPNFDEVFKPVYYILEQPGYAFHFDNTITLPLIFGGTWNGEDYLLASVDGTLFKLNDHTGEIKSTTAINLPENNEVIDLSFNWQEQKLYLISNEFITLGNFKINFFELSPSNGDLTKLFEIPTNSYMAINSIAFDNYGNLYSLWKDSNEFENPGELVQINPQTGSIIQQITLEKVVAPFEPTAFIHFDHANNILYLASSFLWFAPANLDYFEGLYTINTQTGQATHQGLFDDYYPFGFAIAELPRYLATFNVVDQNNNPLTDAVIQIDEMLLEPGENSILLGVDSYNFTVSKEGYETFSGTFDMSYNDKVIDVVLDISTGIINDELISEISLFPNPASEIVNIQSTGMISRIELADISGRIIFIKEGLNLSEIKLSTSSLNSGVYFVKLHMDEGISVHKLQIKSP